jgi:lactate dehydrogenase-like 2-hydroxyacid dehydrogenase
VVAGAPRVLVSCRFPERIRQELRRGFELDEHESDEPLPRAELLARAAGAQGLAVTPADRIDAELLAAAGPGLEIVATFSVGVDHVDLAAATERGVLVANTPGATTAPTAELTLALALGLLRRVAEGDRLVRAGRPWRLSPTFMLGRGLAGLTLGLVGFGQIGREVGRLAEAFGMRVVHHTRSGRGESGWLPLGELLASADVVSLHCPLTEETRHLIDAAALARMKPSAVLVNAARGPVVDEGALVEALAAGTLAGAALDVYEREPDVHPGLLELENVVLVPHLGSATAQARDEMGAYCVAALRGVLLDGRLPENVLNPQADRRRLAR